MQDHNHPSAAKLVLLVEDDADIREILVQVLGEETPYQVLAVADGLAALKIVRTFTPHLILLDYQLPGMNGLEFLQFLRQVPGMEQTPTILLSASPPKEAQKYSKLTILEKPFDLETFLDQIKQFLEAQ